MQLLVFLKEDMVDKLVKKGSKVKVVQDKKELTVPVKVDKDGQYYWDFPASPVTIRPIATKTIGGKPLKEVK